ncbi:E3 SUMO-protein ligase ZBED1 [Myotis yumanensis]|uniref:E3 SUMO-protein ligase ZBED1 n=1 Tax=Myotis yumanensis TaxID=159337 RepID=UPI0038D4D0A0
METKTPPDPNAHPSSSSPSSDLKLVAHPRAKSKVWKYFGFDTDAAGCILQWKKIYCRICRAQIAYSGNTSNLSYHLEKNHAEEFCELVKSNTEQMREAFATAFSKLKPPPPDTAGAAAQQQLTAQDTRQQELTAAVLGLICEGLYPATIVEEPTFRALLRTADPWYELPGRKFFSKAIPVRYGAVREAVLKDLSKAPWCAITLEHWRSHQQNRNYVTLNAHFLSLGGGAGRGGCAPPNAPSPGAPGYAYGSRCLKTFEVPDENAAETMTRVLYEAFIDWGVGTKVSGATTDGGKDVAKACALLDVPVHLRCLGRAFDAAIQRAFQLPKLRALLARCRRLVEYFQQSPVARYLLLEKQKQQQPQQPHCMLVSDRVGCWGATLAMLTRLREQQFAVAAVLVQDSNSHHLVLDAAEWAGIEALAGLLQPFKQVADMLCASRYPAISMVKPLLHMLLNTTLGAQELDSKEVSLAKELIAQELARTYQEAPEVDMFLNVATFLDPRYKKLPFLSALERQQVESRVLEEAKGLLEKMKEGGHPGAEEPPEEPPEKKAAPPCATAPCATPPCAPPPCAPAPCAMTQPPPPPSSVINNMLAEIFCPQAGAAEDQEERHAQVLEELSNFKSQKVLGLDEDPLKWWSERQALFPVLPKVLQKYWCVAPTCAPPERLFGPAAAVVRAKRNRLAPARVDEQVFLYENARGGGAEPEPEEEDEGEWGLDHEQVVTFGDAVNSGFFAGRDSGLV